MLQESWRPTPVRLALCASLSLTLSLPARAADDFASLSFDELANIEITSVSRRAERLANAAASVYVITADDIRRSGATSLPEALRLAPNLHVARVSQTSWTISARGFNSNSANKLLVLIDGRSVYTPLFSGVFWDVQDVMLEDIERIEVVSGPGGTLWGTNAVNGVVNVITRPARQTQGSLVSLQEETRESAAAARYGGKTEGGVWYRLYAKRSDSGASETAAGTRVDDSGHMTRAGFVTDWSGGSDSFSLRGDIYDGVHGQPLPGTITVIGINNVLGDISLHGANLLGRWQRKLDGGAAFELQAYYDRTERIVPPTFKEWLDIVDLQLQHSFAVGIHALTWGGGLRQSHDRLENSTTVAFLPARLNQRWGSLFLSDEVALAPSLRLVLGARMERNDYTGMEFLPNVRLAWQAAPEHMFWGALSRTVRAPSRLDRDAFVPGIPPYLLNGGERVVSETADVIEAGYRGYLLPSLQLSATLYAARYDHLRTQEATSRTFVFYDSLAEGRSRGLELWATWQPRADWRLSGGLVTGYLAVTRKAGSIDPAVESSPGRDPANTFQLRSSWDLAPSLTLDAILRRVAPLSAPAVPGYTAGDLRLGWRINPGLDLSLGARNLGAPHGEFTDVNTRSLFGTVYYARLAARF